MYQGLGKAVAAVASTALVPWMDTQSSRGDGVCPLRVSPPLGPMYQGFWAAFAAVAGTASDPWMDTQSSRGEGVYPLRVSPPLGPMYDGLEEAASALAAQALAAPETRSALMTLSILPRHPADLATTLHTEVRQVLPRRRYRVERPTATAVTQRWLPVRKHHVGLTLVTSAQEPAWEGTASCSRRRHARMWETHAGMAFHGSCGQGISAIGCRAPWRISTVLAMHCNYLSPWPPMRVSNERGTDGIGATL